MTYEVPAIEARFEVQAELGRISPIGPIGPQPVWRSEPSPESERKEA